MSDDGQKPPSTALSVPAKEVERDTFVDTFIVREKGRRYEVAANAVANRALMQINVSKLRALFERAMKPYEEDEKMCPTPKDLKMLADAAALIEGMSNDAYSDKAKTGGLANSLERLVHAATRGAVEGAMKPGMNHSPEARLRRLNSIGKKVTPVPPEDQPAINLDE